MKEQNREYTSSENQSMNPSIFVMKNGKDNSVCFNINTLDSEDLEHRIISGIFDKSIIRINHIL